MPTVLNYRYFSFLKIYNIADVGKSMVKHSNRYAQVENVAELYF